VNIFEHQAGVARAKADAVAKHRARATAILESAQGKRTPTMARYFAHQTETDPAAANAAMAALPAEDPAVRAAEASKAGWAKATSRFNAGHPD
jgi:hypothetical protein